MREVKIKGDDQGGYSVRFEEDGKLVMQSSWETINEITTRIRDWIHFGKEPKP